VSIEAFRHIKHGRGARDVHVMRSMHAEDAEYGRNNWRQLG